ncbi:MAG: hypothetical protein ACI9ZH_000764 [Paracoccaceae bacterium]|jgi:hypothetical protein
MHGRKTKSYTEAFAAYRAKPRNVRWSWAAWSDRFNCIALTVWRDRWVAQEGLFALPAWHGAGSEERKRLLGLTAIGDRVRIILCEAVDARTEPRALKSQWADDRTFELVAKDDGGVGKVRPLMNEPKVALV